jgi:hypothetical protein
VGAIWDSTGFAPEHNFRLIVDYFDIRTEDQIGQIADPNQIASLVFNGAGGTITTCDPNVQPLIRRITFNGSCSVGMSGVGTFSMVDTQYGNGPGQTTNGFDIQATYALPFGPGDLAIDLAATKARTEASDITGWRSCRLSDDRLGSLNFATSLLLLPNGARTFPPLSVRPPQHPAGRLLAVHDERASQYGEMAKTGSRLAPPPLPVLRHLALTATIANIFDSDPPARRRAWLRSSWATRSVADQRASRNFNSPQTGTGGVPPSIRLGCWGNQPPAACESVTFER